MGHRFRKRVRFATAERHTCPLRGLSPHWLEKSPWLDRWLCGTWGTALERAWNDLWHGDQERLGWRLLWWLFQHELIDRYPHLQHFPRWSWPWQPRVCSYCGSVHPDDAVRLRREGWRIVGTTQEHKRYLQPPAAWSPAPCVKVYLLHTTVDQYAALVRIRVSSLRAIGRPPSVVSDADGSEITA